MGKDESLYEIGRDIQVHRNKEIREFIHNCAIARASCHFSSSLKPEDNGDKTFWLVNRSWAVLDNRKDIALKGHGQSVYKNTQLGEILIKHFSGKQKYIQRDVKTVERER